MRRMTTTPALLACDWGNTRLRAWVLGADGQVLAERAFDLGVLALQPGQAQDVFQRQVRPALGAERLPAILCGGVGSTIGWRTVEYVDCPADTKAVAACLEPVGDAEAPAWIVPGVRGPGFAGGVDVMRGEETQVFGWLVPDPARRAGVRVICHPGTHGKWILIQDGRIVRFVTFMTGELFSVLTRHSVLKTRAPADDLAAFDEGLVAADDGGALAARLFSTRTRVVGLGKPAGEMASYLSGVLIGAEVATAAVALGVDPAGAVDLLGEPALCVLYQRALARRGVEVAVHDGGEAAVAGLWALHRLAAG